MNLNFRLNPLIDFINLRSSMQLDSGTVIATLDVDDCTFTLKTIGLVRVVWNPDPSLTTEDPGTEVYKAPCQFPEALMKVFAECQDPSNMKNLFIDNCDWFGIVVHREGELLYSNDEVELPRCSPSDVFDILWREYLSFMDMADRCKSKPNNPKNFKLMVVFGREACNMACDTDLKTTLNAVDSGEIEGSGGVFEFDTYKDRKTTVDLLEMMDGWDGLHWEKI